MSQDSSKNLALFGGLALLGIGGLYLLARSKRSTQQVACLCVGPTPDARCEAIQTLLRPQELVDVAAALLQEGGCFTTRAAEFVASQVSYENDPDGCDRWCLAVTTLARGRGDCDDYALALATLLRAGGVDAWVVVGRTADGKGHAWVEGTDSYGQFVCEPQDGVVLSTRPAGYVAELALSDGRCIPCAA